MKTRTVLFMNRPDKLTPEYLPQYRAAWHRELWWCLGLVSTADLCRVLVAAACAQLPASRQREAAALRLGGDIGVWCELWFHDHENDVEPIAGHYHVSLWLAHRKTRCWVGWVYVPEGLEAACKALGWRCTWHTRSRP